MLEYLSKYVSREVLDQNYKLYVRPQLDYEDIIYHKYDPDMQLNFTQQQEHTQCKAALAVTGAWISTSRQKMLEELGWETFYESLLNPVCNIYDILGIKLLAKLRVSFSPLKENRFQHNFDCLNPACICGTGKGDNEYYLQHCPSSQLSAKISLVKSRMSDMMLLA